MESPYSVLGVSPNATPSEIESAYAQKWWYWNDLTPIPKRAAEAKEMKAQLDVAREKALAKFKEGGLIIVPEPGAQGTSAVGGGFASPGVSPGEGLGKDACPKCGKRDNPPDADYCGNATCDFELRPPCPKCGARVPWHQGRCHKCGVVIEEFKERQRREQELRREERQKREEQDRIEYEQRRLEEIRDLRAKLNTLEHNLAYVESRPGLWIWHMGKAREILDKYDCKAQTAGGWWLSLGSSLPLYFLLQLFGSYSRLIEISHRDDYISPELIATVIQIPICVFAVVAFFLVYLQVGASRNKDTARTAIHNQLMSTKQAIATYTQTPAAIHMPARRRYGPRMLLALSLALFVVSTVSSFWILNGNSYFSHGIGRAPSDPPPPPVDINITEEVFIPAGEFLMGYTDDHVDRIVALCHCGISAQYFADETPQHPVFLDDYYIDKYEVTNARYQACVVAGKCEPPKGPLEDDNSSSARRGPDMHYDNSEYAGYPVRGVTWFQAEAFCAWEGKRLPTEAEWEKAARGIDGRIFPWGDSGYKKTLLQAYARPGTAHVGSYPAGASPYGVMDMAGSVSEWVNDFYQDDYYKWSPPYRNPTGPSRLDWDGPLATHVVRGGSPPDSTVFHALAVDVGSAQRDSASPDRGSRYSNLYPHDAWGFRCARSSGS